MHAAPLLRRGSSSKTAERTSFPYAETRYRTQLSGANRRSGVAARATRLGRLAACRKSLMSAAGHHIAGTKAEPDGTWHHHSHLAQLRTWCRIATVLVANRETLARVSTKAHTCCMRLCAINLCIGMHAAWSDHLSPVSAQRKRSRHLQTSGRQTRCCDAPPRCYYGVPAHWQEMSYVHSR
jgi:hypothetical protein